jgi:hypothetical protein
VSGRLLVLRNVVVIAGAYSLGALVLGPVWFLIFKLITGSGVVYTLSPLIDVGPILCDAILTGLVCGYLLESPKPVAWSITVGAYILLATWSTARW